MQTQTWISEKKSFVTENCLTSDFNRWTCRISHQGRDRNDVSIGNEWHTNCFPFYRHWEKIPKRCPMIYVKFDCDVLINHKILQQRFLSVHFPPSQKQKKRRPMKKVWGWKLDICKMKWLCNVATYTIWHQNPIQTLIYRHQSRSLLIETHIMESVE